MEQMNYTKKVLIVFFWMLALIFVLFLPKVKIFNGKKSINVYSWASVFSPDFLKKFEEKTGIQVNVSYYESNEELFVKLKATQGRGYDLILPSDYFVPHLISLGLIKKINKEKLNFFDRINPNLKGFYYDAKNEYTVPYLWEAYGIVLSKERLAGLKEVSWSLVYDKAPERIGVVDDPIELIFIASKYLYGDINDFSDERLDVISKLLKEQKKHVVAYSNFLGDRALTSFGCSVIMSASSEVWKLLRRSNDYSFVVPKEGSILSVENFAIPIFSEKEEYVYEFLNELYRIENLVESASEAPFLPVVLGVEEELQIPSDLQKILDMSKSEFQKFDFLQDVIAEDKINDIWISLKS
ncbi:MAG: Extracellular solute-binding protein family 1 [candidate division TM6 bacterium GW2011_GWF2_32_72]|nr:MAG: Extracellular solute-binding protein family 1 [candidate division TM6 bacterium GW2011_GWF2_32_72]